MTTEQQKILHKHLMMPLQYQEVYNEIYDHFREAIQVDMEQGLSFQEALEAQYEAFGGAEGLDKIEKDYMDSYRFRYLRLFGDLWLSIPTLHIVLTALFVLGYSLLPSPSVTSWQICILTLGVIPALLLFFEIFRQKHYFNSPFKSLRARGLGSSAFIGFFLCYCLIYGGNFQLISDWYALAPDWFFYGTLALLSLNLSAYRRLVEQTRNDRIPLSLPSYSTGKYAA